MPQRRRGADYDKAKGLMNPYEPPRVICNLASKPPSGADVGLSFLLLITGCGSLVCAVRQELIAQGLLLVAHVLFLMVRVCLKEFRK